MREQRDASNGVPLPVMTGHRLTYCCVGAEIIAMDVTRGLFYVESIIAVYKVHWGTLWVVPGYQLRCRKALR